jgi:transcriptional regulator with XRE-family HTH domain
MSIVSNIQLLCKKNNMSVLDLETELKFGRGTVYKWDKNSPSVDRLQKVAEYFDVTIDSLLVHSETEPTELIIPEILKDVQFALHHEDVEGLTQEEAYGLAAIIKILRANRKGTKDFDKT